MALKIHGGGGDEVVAQLEAAVRDALPGAQVQAKAGGAGHFELEVVAEAFRGKSMVQQHQLVYGAIAPLMAGDVPPVHAIDRLVTKAP
ncbi:MAG: BolA family transcriptional regulator [Proteobacteria bacterium]|nr:MAG: BolA family transcriptional regulator [Pseudomonadota bacterium]